MVEDKTLFLSLRAAPDGGNAKSAEPYWGGHEGAWPWIAKLTTLQFAAQCRDKNVLLAVHGFNVNQANGMRCLGRLDQALRLDPVSEAFVGVLWPGDYWIPGVNYPFEGDTAIQSGRYLAAFCNTVLGSARSIAFVSHSLGARVVLEAAKSLNTKVRSLALTAGAINSDCLTAQYAPATRNAAGAATLSSHWDLVLKLAYPGGDLLSNLLNEDHAYGSTALGREGPQPRPPASVAPSRIADEPVHYGHGDYFPPCDVVPPPDKVAWKRVADFIARTFRNPGEYWK